jgi:hypothetical protein
MFEVLIILVSNQSVVSRKFYASAGEALAAAKSAVGAGQQYIVRQVLYVGNG